MSSMIKAVLIARKEDTWSLCEYYDDQMDNRDVIRSKAKKFQEIQKGQTTEPEFEFLDTSEGVYIHFLCQDFIMYQVICERQFPKKLAKAFLTELRVLFIEEMESKFGSANVDLRSKVACIDEPYYFIRFDRIIKKKIISYKDVDSSENIEKMKSDLHNIYNTMSQNQELLLDRENTQHSMYTKASQIVSYNKVHSINYKNKKK